MGEPKDANARGSHKWNPILKTNDKKQVLFMDRILFLHAIAVRRAGKASTVRLSLQEWVVECDRMALACHCVEEMRTMCDDMGNALFAHNVLEKILNRAVEG